MSISNCPAFVRRFLQHVGWQRSALSVARVVQFENRKNSSACLRSRGIKKREEKKEKRGEKSHARTSAWEIGDSWRDYHVFAGLEGTRSRTYAIRSKLGANSSIIIGRLPLEFSRSRAAFRRRFWATLYVFHRSSRYLCLSRDPPLCSSLFRLLPLRRKLCL